MAIQRNDIIFSKGDASVSASAQFLFSYADAMLLIKDKSLAPHIKGKSSLVAPVPAVDLNTARQTSEWKPPDSGWTKLNVDASFFPISGEAAWGAVVRDEHGSVIASSWNVIDDCQSVEMAEGFACLEGIKWVRGFSALPLILENDCQGLITTLLDPTETRSSLRPVIQEIRHLAPFDPGI